MAAGGIGNIVNVGASYASCHSTIALAKKYPFMYAAIGIHPDEVGCLNEDTFSKLRELCKEERVVAIGEIGLDYYWDNESHEVQKEWFIRQLDLARELDLPVVIHSRDAAADTLEIMKQHGHDLSGVIHCFSYTKEIAKEYVKMGFYIGIGGVITFKNAKKLKEVVKDIPLESILLETDCPYLSPEPNRGKRNSSLNLTYVAKEIALLKEVDYETVVTVTEASARKLYRI